jgi:D-glycero-D-manno-heptose 1,7-bisphosphate phosphatase
MRIPTGAAEAFARLKERGYLLLGVTNQPDVRRGKLTHETVESMNARLRAELPLDDMFTCYHDGADTCHCRKPKAGLLVQAARQYGIDLRKSFMIGDRFEGADL